MRLVRVLKAVVLFVLLSFNEAQAAVSCHVINARGVGQDLGNGNTVATIKGGGLLQGTTAASFVITGMSGTLAFFEGTLVFTTNKATLTLGITGTLDVSNGVFTASGPVTAATGKLAGATGNLSITGVQNLATGAFEEEISGQICVDLAP